LGFSPASAVKFEGFLIDGGIEAAAHFFVSCFSAAGDDLGQWRAFADNGRGFALGFDAELLADAFVAASGLPTSSNQTFHVKYSDSSALQLQTISSTICFTWHRYRTARISIARH
jgi:hypothetical protein